MYIDRQSPGEADTIVHIDDIDMHVIWKIHIVCRSKYNLIFCIDKHMESMQY